ncbi:hypothetical protein CYLTODRAFT_417609 [Cylindrobasidium torrendii FP15055 ss-10]|uniref:Uncharacterized protein n=1 Tax=Cylindrobasidium torrendii FP15055 ss-10 TaxID=1314674 RepID=A0A0D7BRP3_9AGAR|nr:hypothetical protein CYLTODRAFT_417609 [Cylindrobasidium torrendii FP15055 ss-10]
MDLSRRASLTLSDDSAIESILLNIPFFCVGVMTFGVATFMFVVRKIDLTTLSLYMSALLAFGASVFDLSQLLERGQQEVAAGTGLQTVTGLVNTREVMLSLSHGFRLMFYWFFVAKRPRGEQRRTPGPGEAYHPFYYAHSSSWNRWGYLGFVIRWLLLGLCIAIAVLQILWRLIQHNFGTLYISASTMELATSGLFVCKLLLNVYLCNTVPRWTTFGLYLFPITSLLISIGLGVGNLLFFDLEDTVLGRFLRAAELYILIVYLLAMSYLPEDDQLERIRSLPIENRPTLRYDEKQQPVEISAPKMLSPRRLSFQVIQDHPYRQPNAALQPAPIAFTPISTAAMYAPSSRKREPDLESGGGGMIFYQPDERSDRPIRREQDSGRTPSINSESQDGYRSQREGDNVIAQEDTVVFNPYEAPLDSRFVAEPMAAPSRNTNISIPSYYNMGDSQESFVPVPPSFSRPGNDSPVYGLEGIVNATRRDSGVSFGTLPTRRSSPSRELEYPLPRRSSPTRGLSFATRKSSPTRGMSTISGYDAASTYTAYGPSPVPPPLKSPRPVSLDSAPSPRINMKTPERVSDSSFEELLRQQSELDRSIAALKLFTPRDSAYTTFAPPTSPPPNKKQLGFVRTPSSSSGGGRPGTTTPGSSRSVFSLSVFPEPPVTSNVPLVEVDEKDEADIQSTRPPSPVVPLSPPKATPPMILRPKPSIELPKPVFASDEGRKDSFGSSPVVSPIPVSPGRPKPSHVRSTDSVGTQYDVTSFIDDLTEPSQNQRGSAFRPPTKVPELSDVESVDESAIVSTADSRQSEPGDESVQRRPSIDRLRPFLLGNVTSTTMVPSTLAKATMSSGGGPYIARSSPLGPRPTMPGRMAVQMSGTYRPKLKGAVIGGPTLAPGELDDDAYERPRRAPVVGQ